MEIEAIGPVRMPLGLRNGDVDYFDMFYLELEGKRYIVISKGDLQNEYIPLRIESSCVFGHIFSCMKCDCCYQLKKSLEIIYKYGHGMLIYALDDDGRGAGVKLHFLMYELRQKRGLETKDVYKELGIDIDIRDYSHIIIILNYFKIDKIYLITNNPSRLKYLREKGIIIKDRIPIEADINEYNEALLFDEKFHLNYITSYKSHQEWLTCLIKKLINGKANYGWMIVKDYQHIVIESINIHEPINIEFSSFGKDFNELKTGYIVFYSNFTPAITTLEFLRNINVKKILIAKPSMETPSNKCQNKYGMNIEYISLR